jgi:hypothetical protein
MLTHYLVLDLPADNEAASEVLNKHAGHGWRVIATLPGSQTRFPTVILQLETPHRIGDGT